MLLLTSACRVRATVGRRRSEQALRSLSLFLSLCNNISSSLMEAQAHPPSCFSSPSYSSVLDVFLSFSGKDTGKKFTSHLYRCLHQAGITTFMADHDLEKGDNISVALEQAIKGSRISIPIFSVNYASSRWCLDELVEIMESRASKHQIVLPIFFDVDPADVRHQKKDFGQQLETLAPKFEEKIINKWKKALREAADLNGWDLKKVGNGDESKLIQEVQERVLLELSDTASNDATNLVEIDSSVMRLENFVNDKSKDVRIIGIWGMGGIGKSTVADALYRKISRDFQGHIFLEHVGQNSKKTNGLIHLQTRLLHILLKHGNQLISHVNGGKYSIKKFLHAKKVLIILDDVDKIDQLEALVGGADWFGSGSRVIITTRNVHVLKVHKVPEIYEIKELYFYPSLQLFSMHAFGNSKPPPDFMKLSKDVVLTAAGLPLALKVLGSSLSDKTTSKMWISSWNRLRDSPPKAVQEKLIISYDDLEYFDKQFFLDIACFFVGSDKECATYIGEGCGFSAELGIENLIQGSLVKIDYHNKLRMHNQLRDMGRHIVCQESIDEPGKRSRLWNHEEVMNVLKGREGGRNVKGLVLKFEGEETALEMNDFDTEDFEPMSKLRLLQIDNVRLKGDFQKLPSELRWLSWKGCLMESIPTNFRLGKLVVLDLSYSRIKQVWNDSDKNKQFRELKVLNLSKCQCLTQAPDFLRIPKLEILNLEGCIKLQELPSIICELKFLKNLNLSGCSNLNKVPELRGSLYKLEVIKLNDCQLLSRIPDSIGDMRNLKTLSLDGTIITELPETVGLLENIEVLTARCCKNLVKLPDSMRKMRHLRRFEIDETSIQRLPKDFGMLSSLEVLRMPRCGKLIGFPENFGSLVRLRDLNIRCISNLHKLPCSFSGLRSLTFLDASSCNLLEGGISIDFRKLSSLEKLYLGCNNFSSLPVSISTLSRLEYLGLDNCRYLRSLPKLPSSLRILNVRNCISLETLSNLSYLKGVYQLDISNCRNLAKIQGIEEMLSLQELYASGCRTAIPNIMAENCGQGNLIRLPLRLSFPEHFTLRKLKLSDAFIWDEKRCEIRVECEKVPAGLWNQELHGKIIGVDLRFVFTNKAEANEIFVQINRNGERVHSEQKESIAQFLTPAGSHQDQTCLCHLQDCLYRFVHELEEGDEISFTIEMAQETEVKKSGMYVVYQDPEQSTCCKRKRMGDFFTCSYDNDIVDGGGASISKRRKLQLLYHGDGDDDDYSYSSSSKDIVECLSDLNKPWPLPHSMTCRPQEEHANPQIQGQ